MKLRGYLQKSEECKFEKMANKVLKNINFSHPCDIDLYELCELYGMKLLQYDYEVADYASSVFSSKGRRGVITLSKKISNEYKERVLLAEEFSHLYLHQIDQLTADKYQINKMENQAFKLASNILMPTEWLLNIEVFPYLNQKFIMAEQVASEFNVTAEFAYARLKELKNTHLFYTEIPNMLQAMQMYTPQSFETNNNNKIYVVLNKKENFLLTN